MHDPVDRLNLLTATEMKVLWLFGRGHDLHEVASSMCRSAATVDKHRAAASAKLKFGMGTPSTAAMSAFAARNAGLIEWLMQRPERKVERRGRNLTLADRSRGGAKSIANRKRDSNGRVLSRGACK